MVSVIHRVCETFWHHRSGFGDGSWDWQTTIYLPSQQQILSFGIWAGCSNCWHWHSPSSRSHSSRGLNWGQQELLVNILLSCFHHIWRNRSELLTSDKCWISWESSGERRDVGDLLQGGLMVYLVPLCHFRTKIHIFWRTYMTNKLQ